MKDYHVAEIVDNAKNISQIQTLADENPFSLSLGDLMAGLLLIFVLLLSFLMLNLTEKEESLREKEKRLLEIVETYMKLREDLYLDLKREFEKDLKKWKAILDREKISVRFKEPKCYLNQGQRKYVHIQNDIG